MKINPDRPLERLVGDNLGIVRQKLGNSHCELPLMDQVRACRIRDRRSAPVGLRRGLVLAVLETAAEYRETYRGVVSGVLSWQEKVRSPFTKEGGDQESA